jgi:hypothetical protein
MIAWGDEENTNSFYEPHLVLQNTSKSIGEEEAGKIGAEFPPDSLSAPASFRSRPLYEQIVLKAIKNIRKRKEKANN